MGTIFKMIPRWNAIYVLPIDGKERSIRDACYSIVAKISMSGGSIRQIIFHEQDGVYIIEIFCSRYTFYTFLNHFKDSTRKLIWRIDKIK